MPRYRREILSTADRLARKQSYKAKTPGFVDPFPLGFGTLPEKMVYAELSRRGIPFYYLNDFRFQIPEIDFDKWYQADFVIPDIKLIIEIQGAYWHSMEKTIDEDAYKFAIYQTTGWRALAWWDYEILNDLSALFFADPQLLSLSRSSLITGQSSELTPQRRTKTDTSKGIRTVNERRFRAKMPTTSRRKIRKATGFYESK